MSRKEGASRVSVESRPDPETIRRYAASLRDLREVLARRIVGQDAVVEQVLAAILSEGHCLIIGVPGLAKTLLVRSIADLLSLEFKRIQFTPDLMPSDITGATLIRDDVSGSRDFHFLRGPIFSNVILADEINRTPPKTQAALMEAMEERQVTASGRRVPLPRPFFVLATQNPIEQEGTYPLPVSQLDRFQQSIRIDYPSRDEELRIVQMTTSTYKVELSSVLSAEQISEAIALVRRIEIPEPLLDYAARIVRQTRPEEGTTPDSLRETISWGAGPRAVQSLLAGARATAFLAGRARINADDLHAVAHSTLRHRIVLTYHAEAEGIDADRVIDRVLASLPDGLWQKPDAASTQKRPRSGLLGLLRRSP